jgi:death-on-curing protein
MNELITAEVIVGIHEILVDWFAESEDPISPPGVKDVALIESAAGRPYQTVGQMPAYPTVYLQAASLFHSVINNHAFYNGNKRVALVSAQVMLMQHGLWIDRPSDDELFEFTRAAAAHELTAIRSDETQFIADWFERNTRRTVRGEHPMKFGALKEALRRCGFDLGPPEGEFVWVYKDGRQIERIIKQGIQGFRPYHTDYIAGLRKRLELVPENGVDSARFYGGKGVYDVASDFIELRIEVIKRLAKT